MRIVVSGSNGLVGSAVVERFCRAGHYVVGVDNNQRAAFFGPNGDTSPVRERLMARHGLGFSPRDIDIRNERLIHDLFRVERFDAVVHCAAQPSHDWAARDPLLDFSVNATGTLVLLDANLRHSPEAPFVFLSTNKVYGDAVNQVPRVELETRYDFAPDSIHATGIAENFPIDASMHSLFGVSKTAADLLVQEYGRYFGMPTVCLRAGCLTGPGHAAVALHGFLSYLVKANLTAASYTVHGYDAKQVRDNLHADDVAAFVELFIEQPRMAAVYNLGGGKANSVSIQEAFKVVGDMTGRPMNALYDERPRAGDHVVYYSDLRRIQTDYPTWQVTKDLPTIVGGLIEDWEQRLP